MLAMLTGWSYIFFNSQYPRSIRRTLIILTLIGLLSFAIATNERRLNNSEYHASYSQTEIAFKNFTSDRIYLWQKAAKRISEKPWFGWGFSGYSIADAIYSCPDKSELIKLERHYAYCKFNSHEVIRINTKASKAHNIFIDGAISLGLLGTLSYLWLLFHSIARSSSVKITLAPLWLTYITYLLTWYDGGQFSHLGWWVLSISTLMTGKPLKAR